LNEGRVERGFAIWITGLPASGKSTVAGFLKRLFEQKNIRVQILETDEVRKILTPNPVYSDEERETFYKSLVYTGKLLTENGVNVILDATANLKKYREFGKELIGNIMVAYLKCPLEFCMKRDPKGIYRRALEGEYKTVPGLQTPFEEPTDADIVIEADKVDAEQAALLIFKTALKVFGLI